MCNADLNDTDRLSRLVEGDLSQYSEIRNFCPGTPSFDAVDHQCRAVHLSFPAITPPSPSRREHNTRLCTERRALCLTSFFVRVAS
jgi:hypothetical protein